jgi:hypothetical protein
MIRFKNSFSELGLLYFVLLVLFTAMTLRVIVLESVPKETIGKLITALASLMWMTVSFLQFKHLRKREVFMSWFALALIHLGMFIWLYNNRFMTYIDKYTVTRNYSRILIAPIVLLIFFRACRQFSLVFYKKEMGLVGRFGKIIDEDRQADGIETICAIGLILIFGVIVYLCNFS